MKVGKVGGIGEKGALRKVLNVGGGDPQVLCRACVEDLWPSKEAAIPVCVDGAQSACRVEDCVVEANHWHGKGVPEGRGAIVWRESVLVVALGPGVVWWEAVGLVVGWGGSKEDRVR